MLVVASPLTFRGLVFGEPTLRGESGLVLSLVVAESLAFRRLDFGEPVATFALALRWKMGLDFGELLVAVAVALRDRTGLGLGEFRATVALDFLVGMGLAFDGLAPPVLRGDTAPPIPLTGDFA